VLTLASDASAGDGSTAVEEADQADAGESSPGGVALGLAILALLVGIGAVVLGWRATRRTVSS
jgi:hypothetical protein